MKEARRHRSSFPFLVISELGFKRTSIIGGNEPLMLLAGVFSVNKEQSVGSQHMFKCIFQLFSYSIITTEAVNEVANVHDRMPVCCLLDEFINI